MKLMLVFLAFLTSLAGCATSSFPKYQGYESTDASCVEGNEWPNLIKAFSEGEAHVWLKEVDGLPTQDTGRVCLSPGTHVLGIKAHNRYEYSTIRLNFEFQPNVKYQVRANKLGITFHYQLQDATKDPVMVLGKVDAPITSIGTAAVPIFIPKGR